ncbi:HAD-IIB family hydrolase [Syntrophus sp. (in: bacteria)]|jgi:mannosyl-3-phosphoglycerate phosphatase|uniref:HAD-IIB family hydrolase n=1 Tax=Syntrophus sp. (in: bacteria) TaxID=48412 RepID=UPI00345E93A6
MNILVFTDLDGSLLNHDDYSFEEARPTLDRLRGAKIPLVFVTSKTRREVEPLQNRLGFREPFIVENGGGIFVPRGYRSVSLPEEFREQGNFFVLALGLPYGRIRGVFAAMKSRFKITGYGDLSSQEVAVLSGLAVEEAERAKAREFSEPFLLKSVPDLPELERLAAREGMKIVRGGRFYHLIGDRQDKGAAVRGVRSLYRGIFGMEHVAVGIGDSENDLPMLQEVDVPVLIPHPERGWLEASLPRLVKAPDPGSRGWNEALGRVLDELEADSP